MIVDVLQKITNGNEADRQTQTQALGLRKIMLSLDFVAIMFMKNIAYKTNACILKAHSHSHLSSAPVRCTQVELKCE